MPTSRKVAFEAYLNVKNSTLPCFSADGMRIYYLSDITGTLQVWSVPVEGGWPDQLTFFEERVNRIEPSPAGNDFVITRDRGGDEQDQLYLLQGDAERGVEIATLIEQPHVKHNFGVWRPDGKAISYSANTRNPAFFDVYTLETGEQAEPKLVFAGEGHFTPLAWSRSGRYLVFAQAEKLYDSNLYMLDLEQPGSDPRLLLEHSGAGYAGDVAFTPDDKAIYLLSGKERDFVAFARLDLETTRLELLAAPDWDVEHFQLSPNGSQLAYTYNEEGASKLIIRDTASNVEKPVPDLPRGTIVKLAWSPQGDKLVFDFHSPTHNFDIWVYDLKQAQIRQVTHSPRGGLSPASFQEPEIIHYPTFDGLQIPALWFLPPGAKPDGSTPVVVHVHGGPEGQTVLGWNAIYQYLLARGYAVLAPNVRGSSGYGKRYMGLDDVHKRMDSVADLKAAVEWLHQSRFVDKNKIVVWGGSYGGFMVLSAITTYPELWAAGVDIVGIANMVTFLENTSSYRRKLREVEYGSLETDREFLASVSPIHKIDRITAPLIVLHGARDPRVPVGEAEQIVASLRQRQHPVDYLRFEDEGHGITKLKNKLVAFPAIADFLEKHLGAKAISS